jgi:hypothetical protein
VRFKNCKQAFGSCFKRSGGKLVDMADFDKPRPCHNKCGAWIYFDIDSKPSHPSSDKWIPLEYVKDTGVKTGQVHQCPNRSGYEESNIGGHPEQSKTGKIPATTPTAKSAIAAALSRYDIALSIAEAAPSVTDKQDLIIAMLADLLNNIGKLVDILSEQQEQRTIQFGKLFEALDKLIELNKREEKK